MAHRYPDHDDMVVQDANDPDDGFSTIVVRPRFVWGLGDTVNLPEVNFGCYCSGHISPAEASRSLFQLEHLVSESQACSVDRRCWRL